VITSAPSQIAYNASFSVVTPDATEVASVALLRLGSVTHHFNANQRYLSLDFQPAGNELNVLAPADANTTPPGHYMVFIVDTNGVPSVAAILRLQ
jgi:galactose oxidase